MDHIHIRPRRWYFILMFFVALGMSAGGVALILQHGWQNQAAGWPAALFFGACAVVFLRQIFDSRPRLVIDDRGVLDRTWKIGMIAWEDITGAYLKNYQNQPFICLELRNAEDYVAKLTPVGKSLVKINQSLGFPPIFLNIAGTETEPEMLLALILAKMEEKRRSLPDKQSDGH